MSKVIYGIQASNMETYEDAREWTLDQLYEDEADANSALLHIAVNMTAEDLWDRYFLRVSDDGFAFKLEKIRKFDKDIHGYDEDWDYDKNCPAGFETIGLTFTDIASGIQITPFWIKKFELA